MKSGDARVALIGFPSVGKVSSVIAMRSTFDLTRYKWRAYCGRVLSYHEIRGRAIIKSTIAPTKNIRVQASGKHQWRYSG